ncbi:ABC transporter substrate-binding protein [Helicovermis profundi]|uniref:ABC transporter substrate-binding protein n=1 Tax=Helicovermis profundi TaxID=3065157 RepID=A0AAU9E8J8_9FIRM|nr:ABC transporter substrate-binding protein [Clostridia bacterium S502]
MKKVIMLLLILMLTVGMMAGCGAPAKTDAASTTPAVSDDQKDATESTVVESDTSIPNPAKERAGSDKTLVVGMSEAKGEFLPTYYSTTYDGYVVGLIFDQLMSNNAEGELVPSLATGYEMSNDNKTYTFKLRDDVKFSDGTPFTANDVAFTFTSISDPKYDGRYNSAVMELEGYDAYHEGDAKSVSGIKVIDDYTISFTFTKAKVDNIFNLQLGILPEKVYGFEKGNVQVMKDKMTNLELVGTGKYKFTKFEPKQFVELDANDNWFGGKVNIPKLIIKFTTIDTYFQELQAGNIDMQIQVPAKSDNKQQLDEMGFADINAYPSNGYGYMGFNLRDPRLADKTVRQALTYGFNREAFVQLYYNGNASVCNTPISQVSWAYTNDVNKYEYNPEKAIKMLEDDGWKLNADGVREKDGKKLSFVWDTYTDSKYVETMIPMLKSDWEKLGVKVEPNLMDFNSLVNKVYTERDFDLYNMAWSMTIDPGDNYSTFHSKFDVPDGNNSVGLRNPEIDKLLEEGSVEFDKAKRVKIYQEFALKMNEELPYMFLTQNTQWDVSNNRVKGLKISPYCDWTYFIENVTLDNN